MSAILDVVKPDFSHFMEDGKFDAERALDDYICSLHLFIFPAIKMLEHADCDSCGSALAFFEAMEAGLTSAEEEIIKYRKAGKAA
jgi:hypothetical protein